MRPLFPFLAGLSLLMPAAPALAHPHQFIDAALTFHLDDEGQLAALQVVWIYDDLTTLIILEELGMDPDGDGALTPAETAQMKTVVGTWPEGFAGDLVLTRNGGAVALSGPLDPDAMMHDGRLVTTHLRALAERFDPVGSTVQLQVYDPAYYTFYDLLRLPEAKGRDGCVVSQDKADIAAAQRLYEKELALLSEEALLEGDAFPEIGGAFADVVRLECAAH